MKFLVTTKSRDPLPVDMVIPLMEGLGAWAKAHVNSGKMEQTWGFAGLQGGGGILNVESLEELDAIMATFPLAAFSTTEVFGLVDLEGSLERSLAAIRAMMPPPGA